MDSSLLSSTSFVHRLGFSSSSSVGSRFLLFLSLFEETLAAPNVFEIM